MKKHLKEQNSWANLNLIDVMSRLDPTSSNKFLPLLVKTYKDLFQKNTNFEDNEWYYKKITQNTSYTVEELKLMPEIHIRVIYEMISNLLDSFNINFELLKKFNAHLEENRVVNNDVGSYKTIDDLKREYDKAEIRQILRESRYQIHIVYEDETWLLFKPLTIESSIKYGSNTKWCTAMGDGDYFYKYSSNGSLIYSINKINNKKYAIHMSFEDYKQYKIHFKIYDDTDMEIDSFFVGYTLKIMDILRNEWDDKKTNKTLIMENYPDIYDKYWSPTALDEPDPDHLTGVALNRHMYEQNITTEEVPLNLNHYS
jgi:hypothetical protein